MGISEVFQELLESQKCFRNFRSVSCGSRGSIESFGKKHRKGDISRTVLAVFQSDLFSPPYIFSPLYSALSFYFVFLFCSQVFLAVSLSFHMGVLWLYFICIFSVFSDFVFCFLDFVIFLGGISKFFVILLEDF